MEDAPPSDPSPYLGLPPSLNKDDLMRIYYGNQTKTNDFKEIFP